MRGVYEADYLIAGLAADKTAMYLTAPAAAVVEIISASITDASNTTNQQLQATLQRITTLGTPTATAVTPTPMEVGDQASGSTVKGNVTASEPTYTAGATFGNRGFPTLAGWEFTPVPEERPTVAPGASIGIRVLDVTPTALDAVVRLVYREIG